MQLIALKSFADSNGEYETGSSFTANSLSYGRRLIVEGFAKLDVNARQAIPNKASHQSQIRIRGASGLGDAIYLRPIVEHLIKTGKRIEVITDYPEVFSGIDVNFYRYEKQRANLVASYGGGKFRANTTQFQDMLIAASIYENLEFKTTWRIKNQSLLNSIRAEAGGRKVIIVHGGRIPMGRNNMSMSMELLPEKRAFDIACAAAKQNGAFLVRIGKLDEIYSVPFDYDLQGKTSISDLMDIGASCDGFLSQCSFALPLAEIFHKPFFGIWSAKGLKSSMKFISAITPEKVCTRLGSTTKFAVDSWTESQIKEEANAFFVF